MQEIGEIAHLVNPFKKEWCYIFHIFGENVISVSTFLLCINSCTYFSTIYELVEKDKINLSNSINRENVVLNKIEDIKKNPNISSIKEKLREEIKSELYKELKKEIKEDLTNKFEEEIILRIKELVHEEIKNELHSGLKNFAHNNFNETLYKDL